VTAALRSGPTAHPSANGGSIAQPALAPSAYRRANIGQAMGRALAGRASQTVSLARAETLADAVPTGATVDRAANSIVFAGRTAAIAIVANPPNGVDMHFRAAGLENPTIKVTRGALVKIRFVNGDSDSAHGWLLLNPIVRIGNIVHGPRAFPSAFALLGDPTSAGQPATTITFRATHSGTYTYECPVPGHAAMGMQGTFVVGS
jgi:rusticyanin